MFLEITIGSKEEKCYIAKNNLFCTKTANGYLTQDLATSVDKFYAKLGEEVV